MISWIAGLLAAGLAWAGNKPIVKHWGDRGVIWIVPVLEEVIKTGAALFTGSSVTFVHCVFGLVEALHDYSASRHLRLWSALASLASHSFFGQVTLAGFYLTGSWLFGTAAAIFLHITLNYVVVGLLVKR